MAGTTLGRVALFSIHPQYADAILSGEKTVEFRRQGLPSDVTHIVIYATAPTQRIVGAFEIAGIDRTTPSRAWKNYGAVGGIARTPFERYYTGAAHAYVIGVRNPRMFDVPVALDDLDPAIRPPQSYMYLSEPVMDRLLGLGHPRSGPVALLSRALRAVTRVPSSR